MSSGARQRADLCRGGWILVASSRREILNDTITGGTNTSACTHRAQGRQPETLTFLAAGTATNSPHGCSVAF